MGVGLSTARRWEHFEHMADMGVRGVGPSREAAFEEAATAMCALVAEPKLVRPAIVLDVECEASNDAFLLLDWLNALIYRMSAERMIFSRFEVNISEGRLHGKAWGEAADPARHQPAVEVKGATLTELKVGQSAEGIWTAQCVVDV